MKTLGTIYTYPNNPRVAKAQIAAAYNGVKVDLVPEFQIGVTNKTPEFLSKFPLGKVPAMDTPEGPLYESNAIAHYVAQSKSDTKLFGSNSYEAALVQQYISLADNEIAPASATWIYPILGFVAYNKANTQKAMDDVKKTMTVLNKILSTKTFFVGERVTLADITVVSVLAAMYKMVFDPEFRKPYPHVNRWFTTCVNQPEFKNVLGDFTFAEKMAAYDPKKAKKEETKQEAKPKKAEQEVDTASLEAAAAAEEKKKEKNPLDLLPPSKFVLDDWKRFYSNNATRPDAINYFWSNFDSEGYSIWKVTYKYNDELTMIFMSSNLVGGFFQRLERVRKYAFGSMCVLGEANNNEITGYFVFRGQGVPAEVTEAADYDSYDFKKVENVNDPAFKENFEDFLAWDGKFEGKKFADGKIFK